MRRWVAGMLELRGKFWERTSWVGFILWRVAFSFFSPKRLGKNAYKNEKGFQRLLSIFSFLDSNSGRYRNKTSKLRGLLNWEIDEGFEYFRDTSSLPLIHFYWSPWELTGKKPVDKQEFLDPLERNRRKTQNFPHVSKRRNSTLCVFP